MLFAVAKLYILRKIDKDLPPFFIVCDGGDGRWLAYGICRSGVSQMPFGRIANAIRAYRNWKTVVRQLQYGAEMPAAACWKHVLGTYTMP